MKRVTIALFGLLLAGCATSEKAITTAVPIAVRCVKEVPSRPALVTDDELQAMNDYQMVLALWRDRLLRIGYEAELEAVIQACRG